MSEKYILVRVDEAEAQWPPYTYKNEEGRWIWPTTNVGRLRKAIHRAYADEGVRGADMVTHTAFMTEEESATVARVFETAMARAKRFSGRKR